MKVVARVAELVVEGRAAFGARQFERRLAELLASAGLDVSGEIELGEIVVEAGPTLHEAAQAAAQALIARLRERRPR
jgi:hypothetical protein